MFDTISLTEVNFEAYITLWARFMPKSTHFSWQSHLRNWSKSYWLVMWQPPEKYIGHGGRHPKWRRKKNINQIHPAAQPFMVPAPFHPKMVHLLYHWIWWPKCAKLLLRLGMVTIHHLWQCNHAYYRHHGSFPNSSSSFWCFWGKKISITCSCKQFAFFLFRNPNNLWKNQIIST